LKAVTKKYANLLVNCLVERCARSIRNNQQKLANAIRQQSSEEKLCVWFWVLVLRESSKI